MGPLIIPIPSAPHMLGNRRKGDGRSLTPKRPAPERIRPWFDDPGNPKSSECRRRLRIGSGTPLRQLLIDAYREVKLIGHGATPQNPPV